MRVFSDSQVQEVLPWKELISELKDAFAKGVSLPLRTAEVRHSCAPGMTLTERS